MKTSDTLFNEEAKRERVELLSKVFDSIQSIEIQDSEKKAIT